MKELEKLEELLNKLANCLYSLVMECDEMIEIIIELEEKAVNNAPTEEVKKDD